MENRQLIEIMQQEAAVELIRSLMKSRRATITDLEAAERRLAELKEVQALPTPISSPPASEPIQSKRVDPLLSRDLMAKIDDTQKRLAEVCNSMHSIPKDVACPDLMSRAASIKEELEDLWTKYRYLERNGRLPEDEKEEEKLSSKRSYELLDAVQKKKSISEKRSKLKAKISNPKNIRSKKLEEWKDELAQADLDYKYFDDLIKILKA